MANNSIFIVKKITSLNANEKMLKTVVDRWWWWWWWWWWWK